MENNNMIKISTQKPKTRNQQHMTNMKSKNNTLCITIYIYYKIAKPPLKHTYNRKQKDNNTLTTTVQATIKNNK